MSNTKGNIHPLKGIIPEVDKIVTDQELQPPSLYKYIFKTE